MSGIFKRGEKVVFRYEVIDTSSDRRVTSLDGAKTQIVVNNGQALQGTFAPRGQQPGTNSPWTWFAVWDIPNDAPTGPVNYSIKITTKAGKTASWTPPALVLPPGGPAGPAGASSVLNVIP
ncbi:MAG: hypothetical protein KGJ86_10360 [Chloroflexota bacterium]|nr:hypothetical protein [Chloroflexota bacterium]